MGSPGRSVRSSIASWPRCWNRSGRGPSREDRIAFHVRMSFAQLTPRRGWIDGHLVLARPCVRVSSPTSIVLSQEPPAPVSPDPPRRCREELQVDAEADQVGQQEHLDRPLERSRQATLDPVGAQADRALTLRIVSETSTSTEQPRLHRPGLPTVPIRTSVPAGPAAEPV